MSSRRLRSAEGVSTELAPAGFDATLADVRDVEGWMTDAQARRLWDAASRRHRARADRRDRLVPRALDDRAVAGRA